ncbi:hypothetical protein PSTG_00281 [Puccinia striiformis f. sp. tritici PST-78]|uniref:Uncharacterized protein n=1 Tax=Puccinia striiformis f. sp. tritici PST-78 TaxID=1165861 RepID=A0A0L0W4C9_9BASI|nr:hypothetical protein PSTG_00281 [Puccinia striiformis f. sp. tritici PST-78]
MTTVAPITVKDGQAPIVPMKRPPETVALVNRLPRIGVPTPKRTDVRETVESTSMFGCPDKISVHGLFGSPPPNFKNNKIFFLPGFFGSRNSKTRRGLLARLSDELQLLRSLAKLSNESAKLFALRLQLHCYLQF